MHDAHRHHHHPHHPIAHVATEHDPYVVYAGEPLQPRWRAAVARAAGALVVGLLTLAVPRLPLALALALVAGAALVATRDA